MSEQKREWERLSTYRLDADTLAALDLIAADLAEKIGGGKPNRTAAIRFAAREVAKKIRKKNSK